MSSWATGHRPPFDVSGPDGTEHGAFWDANRYQAYEGASVPPFPNVFHALGPDAMTGSWYFSMIEAMTIHAVRCITEARRRGATYIAVRQEPHDAYFAEVQHRLRNSVFVNSDCTRSNRYYFDRHGDTPLLRPSTGWGRWWRHRRFDLDDYAYRTAETDSTPEAVARPDQRPQPQEARAPVPVIVPRLRLGSSRRWRR